MTGQTFHDHLGHLVHKRRPGSPVQSILVISLLVLSLFLPGPATGQDQPPDNQSAIDACLLQSLKNAADGVTVGELRARCAQRLALEENKAAVKTGSKTQPVVQAKAEQKQKPVEERLKADKANILKPFTLMAHRPNYFLLGSYNLAGINEAPYRAEFPNRDLELYNVEAKFQLSIKFPILLGLFKGRVDLYSAYTNRSFWQLYRTESSPFRETNHQPELWVQFNNDWQIFGFTNRVNALGLVHQSNGMGGSLSRSWNRVYANFIFDRKNLVINIMPWLRIPERDSQDDNPDILDFMGWGEIRLAYKWEEHTFSLMARNILESGFQRGALELSWSFPLGSYKFMKGYVQYFSGYGESLIDYNNYANSIGVGLSLTDWF